MIRRGVMSVWKVILLAIGSLVGVAGVTTLGVYISGGLKEKIVEPQDIYFSQVVESPDKNADTLAYYVDSANYSAEYKTSGDFMMTVSSNTEDVTEKELQLSFEGASITSGDYIEDGIIKVPKVAEIGKPFKVELVKAYNSTTHFDTVVGGNSILTIKSSNLLLDPISTKICVDVPVSDFYILPTGETKNSQNAYTVYSDTEFTVDEIFKPTNSKFLFSDTSASKLVFFDIQGENITYSYQTKKFHAGQNGTVLITAYTFSNSFYQRERLAQYGYTYEEMTPAIMENIKTTILADARLAANTKKYKSASVTLQISSATIDSISFAPAGNKYDQVNERFEAYANKYLRLTTNSTTVGDATFGVSVTATAGEANTGALLSNMGIKITGDSNLSILGGRVARVTATSVEFEDYSKTKDYAPTSEAVYYLLPNTAPQNYDNYFWQISSTEVSNTLKVLEINFFTKDENGAYTNYFTIDGLRAGLEDTLEKTFNVLFKERENEEPPAWGDQDTISMLINYKQDGSIEPSSKDLTKDIQKTDNWNENVYQEIRYFVFVDEKDVASILPANTDLSDYFVCTLSGDYTKNYVENSLVVNGTVARGEGKAYRLYEIPDGMLIAKESFTGEVKVFVATIQTKADGAPIMDGAKYKLVNTSYVRTVKVESTLSIRNIVSENTGVYLEGTKGEDFIEIETEYYIPATNEGIINLKIYLKGVEDADKLIRAVNIGNAEGGVYFTCVDGYGDETANYLTLKNFAQKTTGEPEGFAVFEGMFAINQQFFEPNLDILSLGKEIYMQLSYNNGKEIQSEILPLFVDGAKVSTESGDVCHFNVYYPQPVEINWTSENATDLYEGGVVDNGLATINVDIKAAGQTIVWGSRELPAPGAVGSAVDQLNALLEFTLKDQFGREIDQSSGEYQMKFVETAQTGQEKIINLSAEGNKIASFSSANNKSTMLEACVYKDRKDKIYTYDESGNKTGVELKYGKQFNFNVKSEGVSLVEYDASTLVGGEKNYIEGDKGAVTISKYIPFNNDLSISLADLIKVYVGNSDTPVDVKFYFDDTYISGLSSITTSTGDSAKESLLKMIEITGPDGTSTTSGLDTIGAWIGKRVTSLKFVCSFDQTTTIRFVAKDENESLFNITVDLVCMQDIYESNMIASKNEELGYSDYLIEKDNAISIFADKEYDLNEILPLYTANYPDGTNHKKTWRNMWGDLSVEQLYQTADKEDIVKITHDKESEYYYLKIEPCTTFTTAELTIYIRKTYYSFKISLKLYINPNIIAVATGDMERPELDAKSVFGKNLSDYYNFYRATDYIDYYITHKSGAAEPEALGTTSWTATNTCDSKYLALDLSKSEKQFGVGIDTTLTLAFGEKTNQDFAISKGETSGVYGIRKYGSKIVKSDTNQLSLKFNLKYSGTDSIFDETVEKVQKVQYKGNTYLVLVSGKEYEFNDGLTLYNDQTYGVVNKQNTTGGIYVALNNSLISLDNNGFDMQETAKDDYSKTLTIVSHINVIATATGDKFVYYNNGALPDNAGEMKFNYYNDYTDFETLVTNYYKENDSHTRLGENGYALLEETYFYQVGQQQASYNICQELYAGQTYKIIHYSNNLDDDFAAGQVFGFYYDSTKINDTSYTIEVSIVEGADGYIPGIVSYNSTTNEISITHTESQIETYIVLRLSISKKNSTAAPVVWFYRIKVVPSFTLGDINYPYAQDAEYLDKYSREYYISSYVAPENTDYYSDESLGNKAGELSTSKFVYRVEGKQYYKFVDSATTYYVKAADVKVYDYKIDFAETLTATNSKHNSEELRIENVSLGFTYYVKPEDITFVAQSGEKYYTNTECTADEEELLEDKVLTFEDGHYSFEDSSIYYVKPERVKFFANTAAYYFDDECIRQAGKTSAEKEVQKNGDEKYYFTISFDATKTFSVKTAYVDSEEISPENYSNYFEYNFVGEVLNITPVDDTTKLTIVVARTLSLDEKDLIGGENTYTLRFNQSKNYVATVTKGGVALSQVNPRTFSTTLKADGSETTFNLDLKEQVGAIQSDVALAGFYALGEGFASYFNEDIVFDNTEKTITFTTKSSIPNDKTFTIVVYTDTQIAFYIDLTIVGNYTITQNLTQVNAGSKVAFAAILTVEGGHTINFSQPAGTIVDNDTDKNVTFSSFTDDRNIEFTITIDDTYSFNITLLVKANFEEKARSYNNATPQYGQKSFDITLAELAGAFTEIDVTNFTFIKQNGEIITPGTTIAITPPNVSTSQVYYEYLTLGYYFNGKKVFEVPVTYSYTVYKNVNVVAHYPSPAGTELSVEYISAEPSHGSGGTHSADLIDFFNSMANFADKNRIVVEDVAYAKTGTLFYANLECDEGETVLSEQVVVKKVNENTYKFEKENNTYYVKAADVETGFIHTWRLAITSIENLTIRINDTNYNSVATGISANGENEYNIRFTLSGSFAQGSATFLVCVNEVEVEYSVIFVDGNNFTIETNAPNYASVTDKSATPVTANAETIYAEDLANQEQNLFAENRILKYAFKSGVTNGTTYYIKLENDKTHTVAMAKIVSDGTANTKNIDLGRSYKGYAYKGSYSNYSENMFVGNALDDDQIYTTEPTLTKRVVAKYKNGDEISSDKLTLATDNVTLTKDDFKTIKQTSVTATISGTNKETGINYNIYLDSYYSISGVVESANAYTTITLNADYDSTHSATTLLTNTSLGISLTVEQMKQYGGNFTLLTYGFDDCPINYVNVGTPYYSTASCTGDPAGEVDKRVNVRKQGVNYVDIDEPTHYFKANDVVSTTAAALHNYLKTVPDGEIIYHTGLTPRAGVELDAGGSCGSATGADIKKNYITIAGLQHNGKNYDYNISPQGANNDGNYVMMKLVYTITISAGQSIDIENDILFKVLPSSTVTFKSGFDSSSYYSASTIVEGGKTITTNKTTPYTIHSDGDSQKFYFAEKENESNDEVIKALMYKNNSNSSGAFAYEFSGNSENWNSDTGVGLTKKGAGTPPDPADNYVTVKNLVLGEKNFYIDATNDFDYKLRFYFKVVAQTNPTISDPSSLTLTEGQDLVVGAKYQTVTPTTITVDSKQYTIFNEVTYHNTTPDYYANEIKITSEMAATTGCKAIIQAKCTNGTYYKQFDLSFATDDYTIIKIYDDGTPANNKGWFADIAGGTGDGETIVKNNIQSYILYLYLVHSSFSQPVAVEVSYKRSDNNAYIVISQQLTRDTTLTLPTFGSLEENTQTITLTGLKANAISNSAGAISTDALNTYGYKSNVQDVKVKQIEFFYGDTSIGNDPDSPSSKPLITSNGVCFYNDTGFTGGEQYSSGLEFTVPTIKNGFLYGTSSTISGVTMKITLTDGTNECVVSKENVTIQRKDATKLTFENDAKIYDGAAPEVETTSGTVYNDTLEVELAPGASTTFVLTTKGAVGGTLSEETTVAQITNGENYQFISGADTYYVKASAVEGKAPADTTYYSDQECETEAGTLDEETTVIQISGGENYQFTSDADTYYVKASAVEGKAPAGTTYYLTPDCSDTFVSSEFMTLTNTESYTLTRYIGIHTNMAGLTENVMSFNLFVKESTGNVKFNYNGSTIGLDGNMSITLDGESKGITGKLNKAIEQYSQSTGSNAGKPINLGALNLHIASVQELSASHKKNVRLFFLFKDSENTTQYQQYQDFEVSPLYTSTNYDQSILIVDNYYKLSNGDDTFYVVPLSSWATTTLNGVNTSAISAVASYKLHFEINESLGGSAFIDENGTITTASNIDLHTEKIFVNVYMKVSGTDGKFEDENGILLATITLALNPITSWEEDPSASAGVYQVGNEIVVIPTGYSAYETSSLSEIGNLGNTTGVSEYAFSIDHTLTKTDFENMLGQDENLTVFYAPKDTTYYTNPEFTTPATPATLTRDTVVSKAATGDNYVFMLGSTSTLYYVEAAHVESVAWTNRNYHVVYTERIGSTEPGKYQHTNNLNHWTFDSTGKWLIDILVTGRYEDKMLQVVLDKTIYIYHSNISATEETQTAQILTLSEETVVTKVEGGENYQFTLSENTYYVKGSAVAAGKAPAGTPYYTNKDCTISSANLPLTGFKEISSIDNSLVENPTVNSAGIYTKQYIDTDNCSIKTVKWFVYSEAISKTVAVSVPTSSFRVSNVITDTGATIYRYDEDNHTMTTVTYETFNDSANISRDVTYAAVTEEGIKLYTITYFFTNSTTNGLTDIVEIGAEQIDNIKTQIATRLSTQQNPISATNFYYKLGNNIYYIKASDVSDGVVASGTDYYLTQACDGDPAGQFAENTSVDEIITIYEINQNGELTKWLGITVNSAYQSYSVLAVVAGTTTRYYRYTINLYGYTEVPNFTEEYPAANSAYLLSNLNTEISTALPSVDIDDSTPNTYWTFVDGNSSLTAVTEENLSEIPNNPYTYYVRLGINKYSAPSGKEYFSDSAFESKVGELSEQQTVIKDGENYKITIESTDYYVKPSDVAVDVEIRYYKLSVTYTLPATP